MGNKWEVVESETSLSKACPCGKGGIYITTNTRQDDYGRTRDEHEEPRMNCKECNDKYVPSNYGWMPREYVQTYREMKTQHNQQRTHIHQTFKERYADNIIHRLHTMPSKKALYEVLNITPGLSTHNTLETFRKHLNQYGIDSAIRGIDEISKFKSLLHLIRFFNNELSQDEHEMINAWERMSKESSDFLKTHSVAPNSTKVN
ncbi:hypothetical protein Elgi_68770 [Paenibacillus elgii]|uniref:hypothetical protein n=1 Tax=Paenibacillus elgii TaxID=189691 RepID=UPI002D7DAD7F|nr:hypothetical protein Elgi_68770 [Paenibacillus elgii]